MTDGGLRAPLADPDCLIRIVGAHDAIGARLAARAGFDGVRTSGLEISASQGVLDESILQVPDASEARRAES